MPAAVYEVDGPVEKWQVTMATLRISSLSKEMVRFNVSAAVAGLPYNPTSTTVEAAVLASSRAVPTSGDWKAAAWDLSLIKTYVAQIIVGPGGLINPGKGRYYPWLRITDSTSGEIVVKGPVGKLFID